MRAVPAIDLVLGGHDHLALSYYDGRHAVLKAGTQGVFVGRLALTIEKTEGRDGSRVTWTPDLALILPASVTPDPEVQAKADGHLAKNGRASGRERVGRYV